ncbi:MAG: glutamate--cysteine ligase [Phycisphaerales bacterium]|nr:MAG: glutamate--cysteine ligase [Phycisphaerales bacterium]
MTDTAPTPADYSYPLGLFQGVGIELEYMIVDERTLDVRPVADEVMKAIAGEYATDVEPDGDGGVIGWSNELALHVVELKTIRPVASLEGLADLFQSHVARVEQVLAPMGCRLLPGATHPWMDPLAEMRLWPHEYSPVYEAFNRIFDCRGHGWANLQSTHINLPFGSDAEFARLHAAIRLVLPILPALAAASPVMDAKPTAFADARLEVYRSNARAVPSVSGRVIPEPVFSRRDYEGVLLAGIYKDLEPHDPDGTLRHEWVNARGCIARFDRGAIEIRLLDIQECPASDIAVCNMVIRAVRALAEERWAGVQELRSFGVEPLHAILQDCIKHAEHATIADAAFLRVFGIDSGSSGGVTAGELWRRLDAELPKTPGVDPQPLQAIFTHGTLATRLVRSLGCEPDRDALRRVYGRLADALRSGTPFVPEG